MSIIYIHTHTHAQKNRSSYLVLEAASAVQRPKSPDGDIDDTDYIDLLLEYKEEKQKILQEVIEVNRTHIENFI